MSDFPSKPRRVLVTGAGSGIGKATALLLRELDVEVVAVDRHAEGLVEVERAGAATLVGDVTSASDRAAMIAAARSADGLVNAAGIMRLTPLSEIADTDWDAILAVNLKGAFYLARDLGMRLPHGGSIVNVSSIAARRGDNSEVLCYSASKAALLAVTRSLAHAFGPRGVRVNAVLPGLIDTPMQTDVIERMGTIRGIDQDELRSNRLTGVPLERRQGTARECAESIVVLLSGATSYITGQALSIDGGAVMV
jgi:NAD(P)-dependent dehydrogenase (short-subunit alcohol dehydrogenase family)